MKAAELKQSGYKEGMKVELVRVVLLPYISLETQHQHVIGSNLVPALYHTVAREVLLLYLYNRFSGNRFLCCFPLFSLLPPTLIIFVEVRSNSETINTA